MQVVYALDTGPVLPLPAPPGEAQLAEAARRAHAEELVAASARDCRRSKTSRPAAFRRILADTRENPTEDNAASCSPAARCITTSSKPARSRSASTSPSSASSSSIRSATKCWPTHCEDYADETPVRWVQEEPENMGAWPYWKNRFCHRLLDRYPFSVVARTPSASPATGSTAAHHREQDQLIDEHSHREMKT